MQFINVSETENMFKCYAYTQYTGTSCKNYIEQTKKKKKSKKEKTIQTW